jgi:hypothetical protein
MTVRQSSGCQMTMYPFHLNAEAATRNTPLTGNVPQPNKSQALGLTLFYLLSAFSRDSSIQEQQALSIAIKALHERGTYVDPADGFSAVARVAASNTPSRGHNSRPYYLSGDPGGFCQ